MKRLFLGLVCLAVLSALAGAVAAGDEEIQGPDLRIYAEPGADVSVQKRFGSKGEPQSVTVTVLDPDRELTCLTVVSSDMAVLNPSMRVEKTGMTTVTFRSASQTLGSDCPPGQVAYYHCDSVWGFEIDMFGECDPLRPNELSRCMECMIVCEDAVPPSPKPPPGSIWDETECDDWWQGAGAAVDIAQCVIFGCDEEPSCNPWWASEVE